MRLGRDKACGPVFLTLFCFPFFLVIFSSEFFVQFFNEICV